MVRLRGRDERAERSAIRPEIGAIVPADGEEVAVRVHRKLAGERQRAALPIAHEQFRARADPFHRPAEFAGGKHHREVFGIGRRTHAEASADVLRDEHDLLLVDTADERELSLHAADALKRHMKRVAIVRGVELNEARARLERIADEALTVDRELAHVFRAGERGFHRLRIAGVELEGEISGDIVV